jgi:hypothetical protein
MDDGFVELGAAADAATFVEQCRALRFWDRQKAAA